MQNPNLRDFYTGEAECYEKRRYGSSYGRLFRAIHRKILDQVLRRERKWKIALDVASGTGQTIPSLAGNSEFVVACDITRAMLNVSKKEADPSKISFCVADATALPYTSGAFEIVASSRFLHLFELHKQAALIQQMATAVAPSGLLIVDFYSSTSRKIFAPLIWTYRSLFQKRPENDYRVSIKTACAMVEDAGLKVREVVGVGNYILAPFSWLPAKYLVPAALVFSRRLAFVSEQFVIVASKN